MIPSTNPIKTRKVITITPVNNGFIVELPSAKGPEEEAAEKAMDMISGAMQKTMKAVEDDPILNKVEEDVEKEEKTILDAARAADLDCLRDSHTHIFTHFREVLAFLKSYYNA